MSKNEFSLGRKKHRKALRLTAPVAALLSQTHGSNSFLLETHLYIETKVVDGVLTGSISFWTSDALTSAKRRILCAKRHANRPATVAALKSKPAALLVRAPGPEVFPDFITSTGTKTRRKCEIDYRPYQRPIHGPRQGDTA